jgi:lipopolysaccharide export system protein LptA
MMQMRVSGIVLALTLAAATTAAVAQVKQEQPPSPLKGHNTNAPVDVTSERIEVQERADRAVFTGNVHVTQGDMTLDTQRLTVAYSNAPSNGGNANVQINRLDAAGGVVVRDPGETAKGDFGVYDLDRKLITLIGNVELSRDKNQVNGARLVIDLNSGRAVVDGGPPGVNSSGGRVSGHFTVPQKQQQPAQKQQ